MFGQLGQSHPQGITDGIDLCSHTHTHTLVFCCIFRWPVRSCVKRTLTVDTLGDTIAKYQEFREAVRNGELGVIERFWLKYMNSIWLFV